MIITPRCEEPTGRKPLIIYLNHLKSHKSISPPFLGGQGIVPTCPSAQCYVRRGVNVHTNLDIGSDGTDTRTMVRGDTRTAGVTERANGRTFTDHNMSATALAASNWPYRTGGLGYLFSRSHSTGQCSRLRAQLVERWT